MPQILNIRTCESNILYIKEKGGKFYIRRTFCVTFGFWKYRSENRWKGSKRYLITPLTPTSASELLTKSTSVPVGASSMMVVWKVEEVKTGTLSFTSITRTVTVPVPLRDGEPGDEGRRTTERQYSEQEHLPLSWQTSFLCPVKETQYHVTYCTWRLLWGPSCTFPAVLNWTAFLRPSFWVCAATSTHTSAERIKRAQCLWDQIFQASFLESQTLVDLISTARRLF